MAQGRQARLPAGDARAAPEGARAGRPRARRGGAFEPQAVCERDECRHRRGQAVVPRGDSPCEERGALRRADVEAEVAAGAAMAASVFQSGRRDGLGRLFACAKLWLIDGNTASN